MGLGNSKPQDEPAEGFENVVKGFNERSRTIAMEIENMRNKNNSLGGANRGTLIKAMRERLHTLRQLLDGLIFDHMPFLHDVYPDPQFLKTLKGIESDPVRLYELLNSKYAEYKPLFTQETSLYKNRDYEKIKQNYQALRKQMECLFLIVNSYYFLTQNSRNIGLYFPTEEERAEAAKEGERKEAQLKKKKQEEEEEKEKKAKAKSKAQVKVEPESEPEPEPQSEPEPQIEIEKGRALNYDSGGVSEEGETELVETE